MPANALQHQLERLRFPLGDDQRADVRRCVSDYVDWAKTQHWPPERMLIDIKRVAAEARVTVSSLPSPESRESRAHLLMDMVAWSIERYYEGERDS